jgi:hypothetical protein
VPERLPPARTWACREKSEGLEENLGSSVRETEFEATAPLTRKYEAGEPKTILPASADPF